MKWWKQKTIKSEISSAAEIVDPLIQLDHVNKRFRVGKNIIDVLKDINIVIHPREFIVILGPSGSGKSTLLNTLLGLEPPSSGSVRILGKDIGGMKPNEIGKFRYMAYGIVFQRPEWVRALNVFENVSLPLSLSNVPTRERSRITLEKLKKLGMDDHAQYMPTELSGGQQQKVTIARALVNEPSIIVADEPTGNLDSKSADNVMNLMKDLNEQQRKTIILVTHNIDYVRYASRTIYIRDGQVVQGSGQFLQS